MAEPTDLIQELQAVVDETSQPLPNTTDSAEGVTEIPQTTQEVPSAIVTTEEVIVETVSTRSNSPVTADAPAIEPATEVAIEAHSVPELVAVSSAPAVNDASVDEIKTEYSSVQLDGYRRVIVTSGSKKLVITRFAFMDTEFIFAQDQLFRLDAFHNFLYISAKDNSVTIYFADILPITFSNTNINMITRFMLEDFNTTEEKQMPQVVSTEPPSDVIESVKRTLAVRNVPDVIEEIKEVVENPNKVVEEAKKIVKKVDVKDVVKQVDAKLGIFARLRGLLRSFTACYKRVEAEVPVPKEVKDIAGKAVDLVENKVEEIIAAVDPTGKKEEKSVSL